MHLFKKWIPSSTRREIIFLLLVCIAALLIRVPYIFQTPLHIDEPFSFVPSVSISHSLVPKLSSGALYPRYPALHYAAGLAMFFLGTNIAVLRFVPFLFSLLVFFLIYYLGKYFFNRAIAIGAVLFLFFSQLQNTLSYFGRPYLQLQFFSLLTVWFYYLGFVKTRPAYRWLFALSYIFALASHSLALLLLPFFVAYPLFVHLYSFVRQSDSLERLSVRYSSSSVITFLLLLLISGLYIFVKIPGTVELYTWNYSPVGLFIFPPRFHGYYLEWFFPLSLLLLIISSVRIFQRDNTDKRFYVLFLSLGVFFSLLVFTATSERYFFFIFPLIVLLSISGLYELFLLARNTSLTRLRYLFLALFIVITASHFVLAFHRHGSKQTYGFVSYHKDYSPLYSYTAQLSRPDDIVLCSDPERALYFFRCDYFLRNIVRRGDVSQFSPGTRDPYWNIPIIGSVSEIQELQLSGNRIWFIINDRFFGNVDPDIFEYIKANMTRVFLMDAENQIFLSSGV